MRPEQLLADKLRAARLAAAMSEDKAEQMLGLAPGWISVIEAGDAELTLPMALAQSRLYGVELAELVEEVEDLPVISARRLVAEDSDNDTTVVHFPYGRYDAQFILKNSTADSVMQWEANFRAAMASTSSAAGNQLSDRVADAYLDSLSRWPKANPAELWAFLVQQAYLDPYNHPPGSIADLSQSWVRTGGWALEKVFVRYYGPTMKKHDILLEIPRGDRKKKLIEQVKITHGANPHKVDVFVVGRLRDSTGTVEREVVFGIAHVKASLAERRSDDQPLSERVIQAGMESLFLTLDAKASPSPRPTCHGEYGDPRPKKLVGPDPRSEKRREVESEGAFSGCFSWNTNTRPTPDWQRAAVKTPIEVVAFEPTGAFVDHLVEAWQRFRLS